MKVSSYRDLKVWQVALSLVELTYRVTATFPPTERFGLASQLNRSAVSIPSNIAEGHARESTGSYLRHLSIARGSLAEFQTQVTIAVRLGFVSDVEAERLLVHSDLIGRMLRGLENALRQASANGASIPDPRSSNRLSHA